MSVPTEASCKAVLRLVGYKPGHICDRAFFVYLLIY